MSSTAYPPLPRVLGTAAGGLQRTSLPRRAQKESLRVQMRTTGPPPLSILVLLGYYLWTLALTWWQDPDPQPRGLSCLITWSSQAGWFSGHHN